MKILNVPFMPGCKEKGPEKKKSARWGSLFRTAVYLMLTTLIVTGFSLSRYSTTSTGSGDKARIAGFEVVVSEPKLTNESVSKGSEYPFDDISIFNGSGTQVYEFTVTNNSEVAVNAMLVIDHDTCNLMEKDPEADCVIKVGGVPYKNSGWVRDGVCFEPNSGTNGRQSFTVSVNSNPNDHIVNMRVKYDQVD